MPSVSPEWISAIGNLFSGLGVLIGVLLTARQLDIWRKQALIQKRSGLAEDILSSAYDVSDALEVVRSALEHVPREEAGNKYYTLDAKLKRLQENRACFEALRKHQIRAKFLFGDKGVDASIDDLFKARQKVWAALTTLGAFSDNPPYNEQSRKLEIELKGRIYAGWTEDDELSKAIDKALQTLLSQLGPHVRLGAQFN